MDTRMRKAIIATVWTIFMAIACYLTVYAATSYYNSFYSPNVSYQPKIFGEVQIWNGTTWLNTNIVDWTANSPWYTRFYITAAGYEGNITIIWQLERWNGTISAWNDVANANVTTHVFLLGSAGQDIHASSNGASASEKNWDSYITTSATYRVQADIYKD